MVIITDFLRKGLADLIVMRTNVLMREASAEASQLGPSLSKEEYRRKLAELQPIVAALEGLRKADATAAFAGLARAHEALAGALNSPKRDYEALLKALDDFRGKASMLQPALAATIAAPAVRKPN